MPRPLTPAQQAACQQNAQKSTGPRTAAGKFKTRLNAVKHGLTAKLPVLPFESAEDFQALSDGFTATSPPKTPTSASSPPSSPPTPGAFCGHSKWKLAFRSYCSSRPFMNWKPAATASKRRSSKTPTPGSPSPPAHQRRSPQPSPPQPLPLPKPDPVRLSSHPPRPQGRPNPHRINHSPVRFVNRCRSRYRNSSCNFCSVADPGQSASNGIWLNGTSDEFANSCISGALSSTYSSPVTTFPCPC